MPPWMPPKKRTKDNLGLPPRWRHKHGAYYYRVPPGLESQWGGKKEYRLGSTLVEAHRIWADKLELTTDARLFEQLANLYEIKVLSRKSHRTQQRELPILKDLRIVYGDMPIHSIKPKHINALKTRIAETRKETTANRYISVISHIFTMAIEWGLCDDHPVKQKIRRFSYVPRDRYVEDWELVEFLSVAGELIQDYVALKLLTGLRKRDMLSIKVTDLTEDGIKVRQLKTGKTIIIEWTDELREAVAKARAIKRKVGSIYLFHNRRGQSYRNEHGRTNGFDSIWKRTMRQALDETKLKQSFQEQDLRAKTGSDTDELHAMELLDHANSSTTRKTYRRKPKRVKPFSMGR